MLLEFRTENYKSFKDELIFSLMPAPKQKGLDYSILHEKIGRKAYKALSSAIIYGPNASGKTNIIGAMHTFKSIVMRGNIRNSGIFPPNIASNYLELIPNNTLTKAKPVSFSIRFVDEGLIFEYGVSADLGLFLEYEHDRKILKEYLNINEKPVFERDETLVISPLKFLRGYLVNDFERNEESLISIAGSNLDDEELFLMNGFKNMISAKIATMISTWLSRKFMVFCSADSLQLVRQSSESNSPIYIEKTVNEAAKIFGINSNDLGYVCDGENQESKLCSLFNNGQEKGNLIPAELFESYGTIRFVNMFPLVVDALINGGTLIVDEFDASLHPMALMNIINIFHNDELNKKNAQLVFNTHNPIFLNPNFFRRDEIKFVERDDETHCSIQYSLADFGTAGRGGVRKGEDYMNNYFVNRYGAIRDIDFSPILEEALQNFVEDTE